MRCTFASYMYGVILAIMICIKISNPDYVYSFSFMMIEFLCVLFVCMQIAKLLSWFLFVVFFFYLNLIRWNWFLRWNILLCETEEGRKEGRKKKGEVYDQWYDPGWHFLVWIDIVRYSMKWYDNVIQYDFSFFQNVIHISDIYHIIIMMWYRYDMISWIKHTYVT